MPKRIQFRRDTAANWAFHNPRLMPGEIGMETDTQKFKIGDGDLDWEDLPYYLSLAAQEGALDEAVDQAVLDATTLASGYKDAAAGSAAAADASADAAEVSAGAAGNSATEAAASAEEAAAVAGTSDEVISTILLDIGSLSYGSLVSFLADQDAEGIDVPQMNTTDRNAMGAVPDGTTIYNMTTDRLETYRAGNWYGTMQAKPGDPFYTFGADIDLAGGAIVGASGGGETAVSISSRHNFSGDSVFDVADGQGGGPSGFGYLAAPCDYSQMLGSTNTNAAIDVGTDEPPYTDAQRGIQVNDIGTYLWTNKAVAKRVGGSPYLIRPYLRRGSAGTVTGGTGIYSVSWTFDRVDNIFSELVCSYTFRVTSPGEYHTVYTVQTTAANVTSLGYGTEWSLTRLGGL